MFIICHLRHSLETRSNCHPAVKCSKTFAQRWQLYHVSLLLTPGFLHSITKELSITAVWVVFFVFTRTIHWELIPLHLGTFHEKKLAKVPFGATRRPKVCCGLTCHDVWRFISIQQECTTTPNVGIPHRQTKTTGTSSKHLSLMVCCRNSLAKTGISSDVLKESTTSRRVWETPLQPALIKSLLLWLLEFGRDPAETIEACRFAEGEGMEHKNWCYIAITGKFLLWMMMMMMMTTTMMMMMTTTTMMMMMLIPQSPSSK